MEKLKDMLREMRAQVDLRREWKRIALDYALLVLGAALTALAFAAFFLPNDIAPGGITGVATVLAHFLPLGVGLLSFFLNLPLFLLGLHTAGWRFVVRSFVAMLLLSLFIDMFPHVDAAQNMLLAAVFGGVMMGAGLGLVVRAGATTGGTDMAARLIHDRAEFLSIPVILFAVDGVVVAIAAAVFGLQAGLWALVSLYVSSKAMDAVIKGVNTAMQFTIITNERKEIGRRINEELGRGCTQVLARGMYTGRDVGMLLCVVSRVEVARLKKLVAECDPRAFVTVCDVHEALGEGFKGMEM